MVVRRGHSKRKIYDDPESNEDFGKKFIRIGETPKSSRSYRTNQSWSRLTFIIRKEPRIVLTFRFPPPPNPIPVNLLTHLANGRLLNSIEIIHTELLFSSGCLPSISDPDNVEQYEALSYDLTIDLSRVRKKINLVNQSVPKSTKVINLDLEYDGLLKLQKESSTPAALSMRHKEDDDEAYKIAEFSNYIYVRLQDQVFHVKPPRVVLSRLSDEEIAAIQSKRRGLMLSSQLNKFI